MKKILKRILKAIGYIILGIVWTLMIFAAFTFGAAWLIGNGFQH